MHADDAGEGETVQESFAGAVFMGSRHKAGNDVSGERRPDRRRVRPIARRANRRPSVQRLEAFAEVDAADLGVVDGVLGLAFEQ
jgi:hypothetical protein